MAAARIPLQELEIKLSLSGFLWAARIQLPEEKIKDAAVRVPMPKNKNQRYSCCRKDSNAKEEELEIKQPAARIPMLKIKIIYTAAMPAAGIPLPKRTI